MNSSSAFLTKDGHVYMCGANHLGQLGLGDDCGREIPVKVDALAHVKVIQVYAIASYTVFVTDRSWVYVCGGQAKIEMNDCTDRFYLETSP